MIKFKRVDEPILVVLIAKLSDTEEE